MKKIVLKISGMTCSACSSGLEKYLKKKENIHDVSVNLILSIATIEYENLSKKELETYIEEAGFKSLGEYKGEITEERNTYEKRNILLMGILLLITMMISMGHMVGLNLPLLNHENPKVLAVVLLFISLGFVLYGKEILISGIKNLLHKMPNMDTLVLFSVLTSILFSIASLIEILKGNRGALENLYFESACMVIYFVKLGRYLEEKSKGKTKKAIQGLVQVTPKVATLKRNDKEVQVDLDEIQVGDILICRSGEKVAVDGCIIKGTTYADESFITGESIPVKKEKGDTVIAGSIVYDGYIEYSAERIGKKSTISEIVNLVVEATNTKNKMQRLADKISGYFVPIILGIASLTLIVQLLLGLSLDKALLHFVTVLVVACPCSLGLAVPLVMVVSNGLCAKGGIFLKNGEALEQARNIDTILFDKTGTLTVGKLNIYKVYQYTKEKESTILNRVANLESYSTHPIASAFVITKKEDVDGFKNLPGIGISGKIKGKVYHIGNEKVLQKLGLEDTHKKDAEDLMNAGCSILYVASEKEVIALIGVKDIVREESRLAVEHIKEEKIDVIMLTGDNEITASIIAKELGIQKTIAGVLPKDKAKVVKELVEKGKKVMMVGDGINDAPALVSATIGVSVSDATDIAYDSADVILMNNNMNHLLDFLKVSKKSYRLMKQNLFWAFLYNTCMIPIAIGLLEGIKISMNPMIASITMTLSSLTVVANSLRLERMKK